MTNERILMMVRTDTLPEMEEAWNHWYETQHIPNRLKIQGFLSARRFVAIEGRPKYVALYDLAGANVLTSEAYLKLREKEASLPPGGFESIIRTLPNFYRGLYRQLYPEEGEYRVPETEFIFIIGHEVPLDKEEEFNAWYNTEHIRAMKRIPGVITARRFMAVETELPTRAGIMNSKPKYTAIYDLENERVLRSDAALKELGSPWTSRIRSWDCRRLSMLGQHIYPKP